MLNITHNIIVTLSGCSFINTIPKLANILYEISFIPSKLTITDSKLVKYTMLFSFLYFLSSSFIFKSSQIDLSNFSYLFIKLTVLLRSSDILNSSF